MSKTRTFLRYALFAICGLCLQLSADRVDAANEYLVSPDDFMVEGQADGNDLLTDDEAWYGDEDHHEVRDPLELWNRAVFGLDDRLYFWVWKPVKKTYTAVLPKDIRSAVGHFFNNLATPIRLVNTLLQGRFGDAGVEMSRFLVNSTLGVYGFGDVAAESFDLKPQRADFGQTLGVYGIGEGVYLYWPLLGPSNIRDSVGLVAGYSLDAIPASELDTVVLLTARTVEVVNGMSLEADLREEIKKNSLDPYVAMRQAYNDYRNAFIKAGKEK